MVLIALLTMTTATSCTDKSDSDDSKPVDKSSTTVQTAVRDQNKNIINSTIMLYDMKGYQAMDEELNSYRTANSNLMKGFANLKKDGAPLFSDVNKVNASIGGWGTDYENIKLKNNTSSIHLVYVYDAVRDIATYGYIDIYPNDKYVINVRFNTKDPGARPNWDDVATVSVTRGDGSVSTKIKSVSADARIRKGSGNL